MFSRYRLPWIIGLALLVCLPVTSAKAELTPTRLKCEYRVNPLGVDAVPPRLSWILQSSQRGARQSAYQVLVASSKEQLAADEGDICDSRKVVSDRTLGIMLPDRVKGELTSGRRLWWKVRVWDEQDRPSEFSEPAWWEMGLLGPGDWKAKWIRQDKPLPTADEDFYSDDPAPLLRKKFTLDKPVRRARAYVSGLGYYELRLNGSKVGDHVLDPGWTTYGKRVLYSTYDVTETLNQGGNVVGATLGNGWYNPLPLRMWGHRNIRDALNVGRPRLLMQLEIEFEDGSRRTVVTDETWKVTEGPLIRNSVYLGEVIDARKAIPGWDTVEVDDSDWGAAVVADEPLGMMQAQSAPPIKITRRLKPVSVKVLEPGKWLFDMGQNFGGWVKLRVEGERGTTVKLTYGELLYPDGTLNPTTAACGQIKEGRAKGGPGAPVNAFQQDTFTLAGGGVEEFTQQFGFHAFRYVLVEGLSGKPKLDMIEGLRLNSAVEPVGRFNCSNDMFNCVQNMFQWTLLSNLFSVQSDCPHREKFGYGGDIVACDEAAIFNYDMATFYQKAVRDFADAVRPNGGFTETAPFVGIAAGALGERAGPIGWGTAHPLLQAHLLQYYGDRQIIAEQYEATQRWIALLESNAKDLIIDHGIGDHETLAPKSKGVSSTAFYYHNVRLAEQLAAVLGRTDDARRYGALAEKIRDALNRKFLDPKTGRYDNGTQASQSFALFFNLVPKSQKEAALDVLVDDIVEKHDGHLSTGIFGTNYMLHCLSDAGRADVAYGIANQKTFPGWGFMLEGGATTLWEHWAFSDNTFSHNHPMFGSVSTWYYKTLAGIRPARGAVGFDKVIIRPHIVGDLTRAAGSYDSVRGPIHSAWQKTDSGLVLEVVIPPGVSAMVGVPATDVAKVTEGGKSAQRSPGIEYVETRDGAVFFRVGSGSYRFKTAN